MSLKHDVTMAALGGAQYTNDTAHVIRSGCKHFSAFCTEMGFNKMDKILEADPRQVIQGYAERLVEKGYSPSTIHTYLYGPCRAFEVRMGDIKKPKRVSSAIKRSRDEDANPLGKAEEGKPEYARVVALQQRIGIRRSELARLTGASLKTDESGHLCVEVVGGKGGKDQMQRILPQDEAFIKDFFKNINKEKFVFTSTELRNHLDVHRMRAIQSRKAYEYYAGLSGEDRKTLVRELCARWLVCHPDKDTNSPEFQRWYSQLNKGGGVYKLRGDNYDRAVRAGRPTSYDRVALMATSMFHLSHFRLNVAAVHYML